MIAPVRFREAGFVVDAEPDAEAPVRRHVLPDPERALASGAHVKRNVHREAARVEIPGLGPSLLKVHRPHGAAESLRALLVGSRGAAEWRSALYLRAAGIPTPKPWFAAERRRGPFLAAAATGVAWLGERETFVPALGLRDARGVHRLVERASRWIRAMHDRGVDHRDLHSGNVLVGAGPASAATLDVVDLHRVRVGRAPSECERERGLAQWLHSLVEAIGPGGRLRALRAYLGGEDRAELRRLVARVSRRIERREAVRRRSRSRRCVEEGNAFTRVHGRLAGWRARELDPARLERALAEHDAALRRGGPAVAKVGRKSRVTRHGDLVVKEALSNGLVARLRDVLAPHRHRRGYENAHALRVRGIPAARPLAFVEAAGRAFTLYEDLSAFPRLDHRVRAALAGGEWSRAKRCDVIDACADRLARLHRRGVYHGDWKGCNFLVDETGSELVLRLIDTDRVRFPREVSRSRRLRNVAQLAASIPVVVSRADRLRWWRRYARGTDLAGESAERAAARDVAALLAKKTVVVHEPIE